MKALCKILLLHLAFLTIQAQDGAIIFYDAQGPWNSSAYQMTEGYAADIFPVIYMTASGKMFKTTDRGTTWSQLMLSFQVIPGDIVYAGGSFGCTASTNGGMTWDYINDGLSTPVVSLSVNSDNVVFAGTPSGIFRLLPGERSWTSQNNGLPYTNIVSILANPLYSNNIYAAVYDNSSSYFVYRSTDMGDSWEEWDRGLPGSQIHELNADPSNPNMIYAATVNGIYYTANGDFKLLTPKRDTKFPDKFNLEQNYPNPFNPSTNIKFEIVRTVRVNLVVYDARGKVVKTLINNETMDAGYYTIHFDGSNLASGIYFYKIEAGSFSDTKKMVLLK